MHEMAYSLMQNYNKEIERDYEKELEEWIKKNPNNKSLIDFKKPVDKNEDYTYLYLKNKIDILAISPKDFIRDKSFLQKILGYTMDSSELERTTKG